MVYQKTLIPLIFLLTICSGCSSLPNIIETEEKYSGDGKERIYVVSHGWHTGFVVPSQPVFDQLPALGNRFDNAPFIEFGWGDKGFYQAKEITSGLTLQAIFWPTESVVHAVGLESSVYEQFPHSKIQRVCLSMQELLRLVDFIMGSFSGHENGEIITLRAGLYGNSQFYKGEGEYYLMNTCNKWTAKGLKSIGFDISPTLKLTAGSIMNYLEKEVGAVISHCGGY